LLRRSMERAGTVVEVVGACNSARGGCGPGWMK
jgi:hypothetical protein